MNIKILATALTVTGSLLLAGCNGDTASGTRVSGTVTSVDSAASQITVSGIDFDTANATITTDGSSITEGMTVLVDGSIDGNTGVADRITYDSEIEGVVMAHDPVARTMTVMGQKVSYTADLVFDNDDSSVTVLLSDVIPGNVIEVSGVLINDVVEATRIEYESDSLAPGEDVELKGYVTNYNNDTFTIGSGSCLITVSPVNPKTEFEDNVVLADNAFVEVKSSEEWLSIDAQSCAMIATEVESEDDENEYDDLEDDDDDSDNSSSM